MATIDEERDLYEALKNLPDFDCFPIPSSWFKKFNIEPRGVVGPKEYIESNYAMMKSLEPKQLPPLIIDEPQQGGKLVKMIEPEVIPTELVSRPFEVKGPFPAVLPFLKDYEPEPLSHPQAGNEQGKEQPCIDGKQPSEDEKGKGQ